MRKKRTLLFIVLILILAGSFFALISFGEGTNSSQKEPRKVVAEKIIPAPFSPTGEYCGFSVGANRTEISPQIGGTIQQLMKNEGDLVRVGEVVAILKDPVIESQRNTAFQISQDSEDIRSDTKKLYNQKVDEAETALEKTEKDHDAGDASSEDVEIAEEAVKSAKHARDLQISSSEMQVSGALGQFASAESLAQKQNVRAPFSGTITRRLSTEGSFVSPGTPLYSLSAPGETEIKLNVSKEIIEKLTDNQKVSLFENNSQSSLDGIVFAKNSFSGSEKDPNGIVRMKIQNDSVEPGRYLCAHLPLEKNREALLVPENSLMNEFGESFIFVAENNAAHKRKVALGSSFDGKREIISGLNAGEAIITEGFHEIKDGEAITY